MAYYVAEGAVIKGNITIGEDSGIWYNATIRGRGACELRLSGEYWK